MPSYPYKSRSRVFVERVSHHVTRVLAPWLGPAIPQYYVCEFPRSGGTWLARMLADCLGVSRPGASVFPIGFKAVIRSHWKFHPKLRNVFLLTRDGRDVMTSLWFYRMRTIKSKKLYHHAAHYREMQRMFGANYDPVNPGVHLPDFIRYEFGNPAGVPKNWAAYYRDWYDPDRLPWIAYLRYEDLLSDPVETLRKAIEHVTGAEADVRRIERAVEHFSMSSITGRNPGEEDHFAFVRKGIAGDWKNHFTPEAARVFDELGGDMLVKLGYEPDRRWVERFEQEYRERHELQAGTM